MKKLILASLVLSLALSGCATVWRTLGVATVKTVEERDTQTARRLDELSAQVAASGETAAKVAELEKLLGELEGRMDELPADTLQVLAKVLGEAAEEIRQSSSRR